MLTLSNNLPEKPLQIRLLKVVDAVINSIIFSSINIYNGNIEISRGKTTAIGKPNITEIKDVNISYYNVYALSLLT